MEYGVYNETEKRRPVLWQKFSDPETAKNYVRTMIDARKKNRGKPLTLVVRRRKRLIFLHTTENPNLLKPGGGLSVKAGNPDGGTLQIPGSSGHCGYSSDALIARHIGDRSGRRENDAEIPQKHGPVQTTSWCKEWNERGIEKDELKKAIERRRRLKND